MSATINRTISDKIQRFSGACSTFLPGVPGDPGNRGAATFLGSVDVPPESGERTISFNIPGLHDTTITIPVKYDEIAPKELDYIIYAELGHTFLVYINNVLEETQDGWNVEVTLIDHWVTHANAQEGQDTIDVTIGCIVSQITHPYLKNQHTMVQIPLVMLPLGSNDPEAFGVIDNPAIDPITYVARFSVTSRTDTPLGDFRIQLEFNTDQSSPAMDTIIAQKFSTGNRPIQNQDKLTFRGYMGNYSGSITGQDRTNNFDNEKLDNFCMIIKDFNEGVNEMHFWKDSRIPEDVLKDARINGFKYKCKIYGYVKTENQYDASTPIYNKIYIGDCSDYVYSTLIDGGPDDR